MQIISLSSVADTFLTQGIRGLFRGLSPTILGILPYSGIAFALNEQGKRKVRQNSLQSIFSPDIFYLLLLTWPSILYSPHPRCK